MLRSLRGWEVENGKLKKEFEFENFSEALAFLVQTGIQAEKMNHHPEIYNVYNKVKLQLSTHDAGDALTEKDMKLAKAVDNILNKEE